MFLSRLRSVQLSLVMAILLHLSASLVNAQHLRTVDYPGAKTTVLTAINTQGDVTGYYLDSGGSQHGFFTRNHAFHEIVIANSTPNPWGIADNYDVVGWYGYYRGFVGGFGTGPNHFRQFYAAFDDERSPVFNITPTTGVVSGTYGEGPTYGFYYLDGQYYTISYPGGFGSYTAVTGENDQGQFVGTWIIGTATGGFFYDGISIFTNIGYPGAISTTPNRISNTGEIVGTYQFSDNINHGFIDINGVFTGVDFPGAIDTQVLGVNSSGTIVGRYTDALGVIHGFEGTLDYIDEKSPLHSLTHE